MSLWLLIAVGAAGGLGAVARLVLDGGVSALAGRAFPFGTLAVNLAGAFGLGLLAGAALNTDAYTVVGTGMIGGFTTFSTWTLESHRLGEDGQLQWGAVNFVVSLLLGIGAAWAGRQLGSAL